jgi:hypothetical protein
MKSVSSNKEKLLLDIHKMLGILELKKRTCSPEVSETCPGSIRASIQSYIETYKCLEKLL